MREGMNDIKREREGMAGGEKERTWLGGRVRNRK